MNPNDKEQIVGAAATLGAATTPQEEADALESLQGLLGQQGDDDALAQLHQHLSGLYNNLEHQCEATRKELGPIGLIIGLERLSAQCEILESIVAQLDTLRPKPSS